MSYNRIALGILAVTVLIASAACSPSATPTPATYTDPFAYCAAVVNMDQPDSRYVGEALPEAIVKAIKTASGASEDAPDDWFARGSFWRCMDGKVYGCFVGANIPCESKANTDRNPSEEVKAFCAAQPNAEVIPAFVTGHETVYEWRCTNGAPEIVRQVSNVDARGYVVDFWYELNLK
ncbi:MAG: hypothetical protein FJ026_03345 [Chloroflexi bacterium]|nr:hypothetical protein [Chloroflexota bacterium]